jgi:hypothetical protein
MFKNLPSLLPLFALLFGILGCGLFRGSNAEIVFAATDVGTPEGEKASKEIWRGAGGTLSSADGRLSLRSEWR